MTQPEIEAALNAAFSQCEAALHPLSEHQKQILLQAMQAIVLFEQPSQPNGRKRNVVQATEADPSNPLEQLTAEERQTFLAFVERQERQNQPWKITLLNDWLSGKHSGDVQFIRERYGIPWLEQITFTHLASYINLESEAVLRLNVGDHIEVTNGLWEWVQETGPCSREWFPCTVISIRTAFEDSLTAEDDAELQREERPAAVADGASVQSESSCTIRFEDGSEYEIQGVYDWNRPNWRLPGR